MQWSFVEGQFAKAVFWVYTAAEARKRGEQEGLETLLVHADNVVFYPRDQNVSRGLRFTPKNTAWGVRWQHWNSKELTGVHTSSGAWGLMRWYAQNLTNPSILHLYWGVLHGCRQLVTCVLWFISKTSATRIYTLGIKTAIEKMEEGADDVKSLWSLWIGLHLCYNEGFNEWPKGRPGGNFKRPSQFGSKAATRLCEVGIASNRGSACRGEHVPGPCTHRPSHSGNFSQVKTRMTFLGWL